jgi:hypothetical protein
MHLYELRLTEPPELQIDRREVVEACFVHLTDQTRSVRAAGSVDGSISSYASFNPAPRSERNAVPLAVSR